MIATMCTLDGLEQVRVRPLNLEHAEAFMRERYFWARMIAFTLRLDGQLSEAGFNSFPLITGRCSTLPVTREWSLALEQWRKHLSASDALAFNTCEFSPELIQV